ncbi:MAG: hypothetical protein Q9191_002481 [Dirinaria sp. TL-2023a]
MEQQGEEVLHLPVIVEAAESSPTAARAAANGIRKFLSKDNFQRAYVQYNAIMLVRILADNPGKTFTKNLDSKFVVTVKELLRDGRDMSVQQILRETLDNFETQKENDENLNPMREMWTKYKQKMQKRGGGAGQPGLRPQNGPVFTSNQPFEQQQQQQQNYFARQHHHRGLPPPHELVGRIEEAKTSAKLLQQVVQSTPPNEFVGNELIKEFVDRCSSASRSIQGYIHSDNPAPDEDTLLTLIETNDQLSVALSRHQRAMLQSRKALGNSPLPSPPVGPPPAQTQTQPQPQPLTNGASEPPPNPAPAPGLFSRRKQPSPQPQSQGHENPFSDHHATSNDHNLGVPNHGDTQSFESRQDEATRGRSLSGAGQDVSPISPEDARQPPVQYRF